jgi:hypothetical protein
MKNIFCPTVPQSGTWFILRLFEKLGYEIKHAGVIMRDDEVVDWNIPMILHAHVFPFYYNPAPYKDCWPSFGGDPIDEYIVRKNKLSIGGIKLLCNLFKTIIPIRDPLASLLTRQTRAPNLRHFYIVDAYVEVSKLADNPNVFFFPVDLDLDFDEKKQLLVNAIRHCGLDPEEHDTVLGDVATHWKKENVTPNNKYHALYDAGNIDEIERLLGHQWAEVVHLKNMSGFITPFLGKLGYNEKKTLIW